MRSFWGEARGRDNVRQIDTLFYLPYHRSRVLATTYIAKDQDASSRTIDLDYESTRQNPEKTKMRKSGGVRRAGTPHPGKRRAMPLPMAICIAHVRAPAQARRSDPRRQLKRSLTCELNMARRVQDHFSRRWTTIPALISAGMHLVRQMGCFTPSRSTTPFM